MEKIDGTVPTDWFLRTLTNLPFGLCAIYFDLKVLHLRQVASKGRRVQQNNGMPPILGHSEVKNVRVTADVQWHHQKITQMYAFCINCCGWDSGLRWRYATMEKATLIYQKRVILLMEEILHHLGCIKPCK